MEQIVASLERYNFDVIEYMPNGDVHVVERVKGIAVEMTIPNGTTHAAYLTEYLGKFLAAIAAVK